MIPRGLQYIFESINSEEENNYTIYLSFIQIYNEKVYDCLQDSKNSKPLKIREDKYSGKVLFSYILGVYIEGLSEYSVNSMHACEALLKRGEKHRVTRQTKANICSSRSHSILQIMLESK